MAICMDIKLRGGHTTEDRRLDRLPQWDERNENYPIRTLLQTEDITTPRSYTWPLDTVLDQGREGACVGFSISHELRAKPRVVPNIDDAFAKSLYKKAQTLDPWVGEDYEGTSLLAGVKAAQQLDYLREYRWATNVDDLAIAVSRKGPAVLGIAWYDGMYTPTYRTSDSSFWIRIEGKVVGGHAILCRGYSVRERAFVLHNSWGSRWGKNGLAWISSDDMTVLLSSGGEAVIPIVR